MSEQFYELYCGNSIEILKTMTTASVDTIITDLPYGNGTNYASYEDTLENLDALISAFMPEACRIAHRTLVTCGVANIQRYPMADWILSWTTPAGTGSSKWGFCCWQPILAYGKDPYLQARLGRRPDTIVLTRRSEKNGHPCPKPIEFMRWLVERSSLPGNTVLDPFMGSGTTGVACILTGRNFIGIELDEGYVNIAQKRIENAWLETEEKE